MTSSATAKIGRQLLLVSCLLFSAACSQNLYVAHDTVVGINAQINPGRQKGRILIGYDRDFATVIPTSPTAGSGGDEKEAMALIGCTDLEVDGVFLSYYSEELVTGKAAVAIAKKLGSGQADPSNFFKCQQGDLQ